MTITGKKRKEIEAFIYKGFDAIDKTHNNSNKYKEIFNGMNDQEFTNFIALDFPFRFYHIPWEVSPNIKDIKDGLDAIGVSLMEKLNLNYLHKNSKGEAVKSQECLVLYPPEKCMQQLITKKNKIALETNNVDMTTGLLNGDDKGGKESDREFDSLGILGLNACMEEFSTARADAMISSSLMNSQIVNTGSVSLKDIRTDSNDSLARHKLYAYLIGAHIKSNLLGADYMTPYTLENKSKKITRM